MLRQEVYALDGTPKAAHPYTVTEQNFTIRRLQPRDGKPSRGVLHPRARDHHYHYERNSTTWRRQPPIRASAMR